MARHLRDVKNQENWLNEPILDNFLPEDESRFSKANVLNQRCLVHESIPKQQLNLLKIS